MFTYLEKLTRAGIGETIVAVHKTNRNGRQAFMELDQQFTGGAYKTLLATKAWNTLHTTKFQGLINYNWAAYKSDVDEAFRQLLETGTFVDDATKVHHLMNGIMVDYLDDPINYVRQNLMNNYHAASVHLSGAVLTKMSRLSQRNKSQRQRGISQLSTRNYTSEEWNAFSEEERKEIRKLRNQNADGNRGGQGRQGNRGRTSGRSGRGNGHSGKQGRNQGRGGNGGRGNSNRGERDQATNQQGRGNFRQVRQVAAEEKYDDEEEDVDERCGRMILMMQRTQMMSWNHHVRIKVHRVQQRLLVVFILESRSFAELQLCVASGAFKLMMEETVSSIAMLIIACLAEMQGSWKCIKDSATRYSAIKRIPLCPTKPMQSLSSI